MTFALYVLVLMSGLSDVTAESSTFEIECGVKEMKEEVLAVLEKVEGNVTEVQLQNREHKEKMDELQVQNHELVEKMDRMEDKIDDLTNLLKKVNKGQEPISSWSFDNNLEDSIGELHGSAIGSARLENGALILDGGGYVKTANLKAVLNVKTLEAWVLLENLAPTGGGVITVAFGASGSGHAFDSIVWSEGNTHAGMWLSGSEYFKRSQAFGGLKETQSVAAGAVTPVHLVMVYQDDGNITCYRNGLLYGTPYTKQGPYTFDQNAVVLFGLRHENRGYSKARIYKASLYNVALTHRDVTYLYENGYN